MKRQAGFSLIELMMVVGIIGVLSSIVLPQFISSRQAAREAAAIGTMRTLVSAEGAYFAGPGGYSSYGLSSDLVARNLIDASFAAPRQGYLFQITQPGGVTGYVITATPQGPEALQMRFFLADESGVIRQNLGAPADANSSPIPSR